MTASRPLDLVLGQLRNVKANGTGHTARCPAHDDAHNSLSVREGEDGRVLLNCFAGCEPERVVAALGLTMADLFVRNGTGGGGVPPGPAAQPRNGPRRPRPAAPSPGTRPPSACRSSGSAPSA